MVAGPSGESGGKESATQVVLVVEDDSDIREALALVLRDEGYTVEDAPNGKVALEHAHQHRPDLILLDLMMPVMNGWQFREVMLKDPELAAVPVVVLSAAESARDHAPAMGVSFLQKPVELADLLKMVHAAIGPPRASS